MPVCGREFSTSPKARTSVNMTMIRDLAHHVVNYELALAKLGASYRRQRIDHQSALGLGRNGAMCPEDSHRGVARVAIEDGEDYGMGKARVMLRVFTQFA
jgi:hypothetical protein